MSAIVVDRITAPKEVHIVILATRQRGIEVADGIEVPNQLTLKERDDPGLPRGLRSSQRSLNVEVGGRQVSVGVMVTRAGLAIAGFEDRSGQGLRNVGVSRSWKKQGDRPPLEPPEERSPGYAVVLAG